MSLCAAAAAAPMAVETGAACGRVQRASSKAFSRCSTSASTSRASAHIFTRFVQGRRSRAAAPPILNARAAAAVAPAPIARAACRRPSRPEATPPYPMRCPSRTRQHHPGFVTCCHTCDGSSAPLDPIAARHQNMCESTRAAATSSSPPCAASELTMLYRWQRRPRSVSAAAIAPLCPPPWPQPCAAMLLDQGRRRIGAVSSQARWRW